MANIFDVNYICLASRKKLGDSTTLYSQVNLKNKISHLCPFGNDDVNQQPVREE